LKHLRKLRKDGHGLSQAEISEAAQSLRGFLQANTAMLEEERERDTCTEGTREYSESQARCAFAKEAVSDAAAGWKTKLGQLKAKHPKLEDSIVNALSVGDTGIKDATNSMLGFLSNPDAATAKDGGKSMQESMGGQTSKGKPVT
jgi:hypothetical protein